MRYSFIYLVWIGASAAVKERAHIRIDVLFHYLSAKQKSILYIFGNLVMLGVAILGLITSFETVEVSWKFGSVSHGLRVSMVWFFMAVPIGFSLMVYRLVFSTIQDINNLRQSKPPYEGERLFD